MVKNTTVYSGIVFRFGSKEANYPAEIHFDEFKQGIISIFKVSREDAKSLHECEPGMIALRLHDNQVLSLYKYRMQKMSTQISTGTDNFDAFLFDVIIISSLIIRGSQIYCPDNLIHKLRLSITCGHELFGNCPYDINNWFEEIVKYKAVNIPMQCKQILTSTNIGELEFVTAPKPWFSADSFSFGFLSYILFEPKHDLKVEDIHCCLEQITDFFSILCGEHVSINELEIIEAANNTTTNYEYIGYCNFPKLKLKALDNSGIDSTVYKRKAIFKLTDFTELQTAFDYWLSHYKKLYNTQQAYKRILLDEEVNVCTVNKFLAAMQLIEGYSQAYTDEKEKKKEFEKHKKRILEKLSDEEDKTFVKAALMMPGTTFKDALRDFMWKGLSIFKDMSREEFRVSYEELIDNIVKDRNYYTHSSNRDNPQLSFDQHMDIAVIVKILYRCLLLESFGISSAMICSRLSNDRIAVAKLKEIFNVDIPQSGNILFDFDNKMRSFSSQSS